MAVGQQGRIFKGPYFFLLCIHGVMTAKNEKDCLLYRRLGARSECVGQTTLAAILAVVVESHEDTSTTLGRRAFTTEALDLAVGLDLVILQDCHLDLLTLVFYLLGGL